MRFFALFSLAALVAACTSSQSSAARQSAPRATDNRRESDPEKRLSRVELELIESEAQVEVLQNRLDDAVEEVVRTMAKLQTLASRAEAASAMAEADVALQELRAVDGSRQLLDLAQATRLSQRSTAEFNKQNYGGALYLANQAKTAAAAGHSRLAGHNRSGPRSGERPFAVPVRLKVSSRGNIREGPGTNFKVAFAVGAGTLLTGVSHTEEWIRVLDDNGRAGWIFRPLIGRP